MSTEYMHEGDDCVYCDMNRYDIAPCDECDGEGCDECQGHGFVGYSW